MESVRRFSKSVEIIAPLFLLVGLAALSYVFYANLTTWFPSHIHAWTQSDRLALVYGFLDNGLNLFLPQTYNVFTPGGVTGVDLPIHEYIVALIMHVTGTRDPLVFRLYTLMYTFLGYGFLYAFVRSYTQSILKALVVVTFTFLCPIITYYQFGFIPSITSFSSVLIGCYFYWRYLDKGNRYVFDVATGFFVLAALPRMSVNIVLIALIGITVLRWIRQRRVHKRELATLLAAVCIVGISLLYKQYLNTQYGSRFLTVLMPAEGGSEFSDILTEVWQRWRFQFFTVYHWVIFGLAIGSLLIVTFRRKLTEVDRALLLFSGVIFFGSLLFFFALAKQFVAHEYYFLDSLYPASILLLIIGIGTLQWKGYLANWFFPSLFMAASIGGAVQSAHVQDSKYQTYDWDRGEVTRLNYNGAEQLLQRLEIESDAKMLVLEPYSTNAPLLLMDRKGYTVINTTQENILRALDLPFDYIVCQDIYVLPEVIHRAPWLIHCLARIGGNDKISIYEVDKTCDPTIPVDDEIGWEILQYDDYTRYKGSVAFVDTTGAFHNTGELLTDDKDYGISFELLNADSTSYTHIVATCVFDSTAEIDRQVACTIVMSVEGTDGSAIVFETQRVEIGKRESDTRSYIFNLPSNMPSNATLRCYVWNQFRVDVPITELSIVLFERDQ